MNFDKAKLLASGTPRLKKIKTDHFLSLTLLMAAVEEGHVGSWEQSQSTSMASVKMSCQISAETISFTADYTFAHLLKNPKWVYTFKFTPIFVMCSVCQPIQQAKG